MKKLLTLLLSSSLLSCEPVLAQQWDLTNNDLTIGIQKNSSGIINLVGKWLATFSVVGDSVKFVYQQNQDDRHFTLYFDKDSVNTPAIASASALYDTLKAWTTGAGGGATVFTDLTDVPNNYTGDGLKLVRVNAGETGLEFFTSGAGGEDLAATLAIGNTTSGSDIRVSAGDSIQVTDATANTIASFSGNQKLQSLATATYPNLTELSYVKGVTSAIQTQINTKVASTRAINTTSPITGGGDLSADRTIACATCVTSAASLTNNSLMTGAGSQGSQTITTGTGVVTALGVNVGTAGAFVVNGGALGTPSSGTLTNATGLPISSGVSGLGANVATFLGTPSSANFFSAITDETGSGLVVGNNSPTFLDDITIGTAATATGDILINGLTSGTVTITTQDAAGTWTLFLPADDGNANDVLTTDGAGNSTWQPVSATVITTANEAADASCFPVFVNAATGSQAPKTNASLTFDASIARFGSSSFVGGAFLSSAANPAATGVFRLANTGKVSWRNAANSNQFGLSLNASDVFEFEKGIKTTTGVVDAFTGFQIGSAAALGKFLVGDGTNYIASTSTIPSDAGATAGKHLKSDGTNYVLTTATISDAPSTAGKVMVSDGTNWITSTPTFPNASATSGKVIKSDGTNWVASTETWAAPGTAGNRLVSDGTNWTSGAAATCGVLATPTSTTTSTITHNLGRTPTIIRIHGIGSFVSNAAATPTPHSHGTWTLASGNTCVYMTHAGTTSQGPQTSTTFSVFVATSSGNTLSGIVQNVGATTFDIAWTETGTTTAQAIQWDAE